MQLVEVDSNFWINPAQLKSAAIVRDDKYHWQILFTFIDDSSVNSKKFAALEEAQEFLKMNIRK